MPTEIDYKAKCKQYRNLLDQIASSSEAHPVEGDKIIIFSELTPDNASALFEAMADLDDIETEVSEPAQVAADATREIITSNIKI